MNGQYAEGEEHQKLTVTFEFKVKQSPGTEAHLRQIVEGYLRPKGVPVDNTGEGVVIVI